MIIAEESLRSIGLPWPATGIFGESEEMSWSGLISSAPAILASRSAKPVSEREPPMSGIFGGSAPESFAQLDPDSSCWKTSQATFLSGLETYSETWPDSGTMRNGRVYELRTSAPATSGSGCSLWPTASASVANDGETIESWKARQARNLAKHLNGNGMGTPLTIASIQWPTPNAHDATGARGAGFELTDHHYGDRKDEMGLDQQARMFWQTPNQRDWKSETGSENNTHDRPPNLSRQVYRLSPPAPAIPDGQQLSESDLTSLRRSFLENAAKRPKRRLNPRFVSWLMGFDPTWIEL